MAGITMDERMRRLADKIIEHLPAKTTLGWVEYDDQLSPDQVQQIFSDPGAYAEVEQEVLGNLEEGIAQAEQDYIVEAIMEAEDIDRHDAVTRYRQLRDADSDEHFARVQEAIAVRNDYRPFETLLKQTRPLLLRYRLSADWADWPIPQAPYRWDEAEMDRNIVAAAKIFQIDPVKYHDKLKTLLENADGGSPEIIWYGKPQDLFAGLQAGDGRWESTKQLTFHDPRLLVIDNFNGSGMDIHLSDEKITVPLDASRIVVDDAKGNGYGWDSIAGVVKSAYETTIDITDAPDIKTPRVKSPSL